MTDPPTKQPTDKPTATNNRARGVSLGNYTSHNLIIILDTRTHKHMYLLTNHLLPEPDIFRAILLLKIRNKVILRKNWAIVSLHFRTLGIVPSLTVSFLSWPGGSCSHSWLRLGFLLEIRDLCWLSEVIMVCWLVGQLLIFHVM